MVDRVAESRIPPVEAASVSGQKPTVDQRVNGVKGSVRFVDPNSKIVPATKSTPPKFIVNGKEFVITHIHDSKLGDIPLDQLTQEELNDLSKSMELSAKATNLQGNFDKIEFVFNRAARSSWFSRVFRGAPANPALLLTQITTHANAKKETIEFNIGEYDQRAQQQFLDYFAPADRALRSISRRKPSKPLKTLTPDTKPETKDNDPKKVESAPTATSPKPPAIDPNKAQPHVPNYAALEHCIRNAGSQGNRCAALSVAKNELAINDLDAIIKKYGLNELDKAILYAAPKANRKETLSLMLIRIAVNAIKKNPDFRDENKLLPSILSALQAYNNDHKDAQITWKSKEEAVLKYAELIRIPGQMLDIPFFLALNQPIVVIQKQADKFTILQMSDNVEFFSGKQLPNIVFYDGNNHYKSVILDQKGEEVVDNMFFDYAHSLHEGFLTALNRTPPTAADIKNHMTNLLTRFPGTKSQIIEDIKAKKPGLDDTLLQGIDDHSLFIDAATQALI